MCESIAKTKVTQLLDERAFEYTKHHKLFDEIADRVTAISSLKDININRQSDSIELEADLSSNTPLVIDTIAHHSGGKTSPSFDSSWSYLPPVHLHHV